MAKSAPLQKGKGADFGSQMILFTILNLTTLWSPVWFVGMASRFRAALQPRLGLGGVGFRS